MTLLKQKVLIFQQLFKNLSGLVKKKNNCFSEVAKISTVNVTPP